MTNLIVSGYIEYAHTAGNELLLVHVADPPFVSTQRKYCSIYVKLFFCTNTFSLLQLRTVCFALKKKEKIDVSSLSEILYKEIVFDAL